MTREELESALAAARDAHKALQAQVKAEADYAAERVRQKYVDELKAASEAHGDAAAALHVFVNANASHPWEGKRVYCDRQKKAGSSWRPYWETYRQEAIVEVMRESTDVPAHAYRERRVPAIGEPFVRLINAGGVPGKRIEAFRDGAWKLVEGEAA